MLFHKFVVGMFRPPDEALSVIASAATLNVLALNAKWNILSAAWSIYDVDSMGTSPEWVRLAVSNASTIIRTFGSSPMTIRPLSMYTKWEFR